MDVRQTYLRMLVEDVEPNLARFDEATGRFLTDGGWAVTNQDIVYPLAFLYTAPDPANPYYQDERILYYALRGADAWRDFQYPDGRFEFVKVDGSKWGPIYMPWSLYHWLETYALLRQRLDLNRYRRWEEGLELAYSGVAEELAKAAVHNIPTWHAMALYRAGQLFGRPHWQDVGRRMIHMAAAEQTPQGYWREHQGPTTSYNFVYVHAIGLYYEFSKDESVLPCLERATEFHIRYTYPDGRAIETIDGRVKYHDHVPDSAHAAFSLFPRGRRYARFLVENMLAQRRASKEPHVSYILTSGSMKVASAEYGLSPRLVSAYTYYHEGPESDIPQDNSEYHIHDEGHAIIRKAQGWCYVLSGVVTPPTDNRWGMDRQSFLSVWREGSGLIIGGGNSRSQPEWSNFIIAGGGQQVYLPGAATLSPGTDKDAVTLVYAGQQCAIEVRILSRERLLARLSVAPGSSTRGQLPFKLSAKSRLTTDSGETYTIGREPFTIIAGASGDAVVHEGWRLHLPAGSSLTWPVFPFNPYAADGAAPIEEAMAVLSLPLEAGSVDVVIEAI